MVCGINAKATGERIDTFRKERGYSVKDIQKRFGFETPQAVYKWIRGKALPNIDNLMILADFLGVTVDDILVPIYI